jgi:OmpA family
MPLRHPMSVLLVTLAFGSIALAKQPVSAVCTTDPLVTYAGATISVHVTPDGFLPHRKLTYTYRSTDGEVTGDASSTGTVNTTGLQPGNYNVSSLVSDDHKPKQTLVATCQASFTIREPPSYPPQMHVRAEPQAIDSGTPVTVTAEGFSRDNRPLSFTCLANRGALAGSGTQYALDTTGLASGIVNINCTVQDDRALSGFAATAVTVTLPPPPPAARKYGGGLDFSADKKRPTRVDNAAKGILDRYADALAADPDATAVVVGYNNAAERVPKKHRKALPPQVAALRAVNTKAYLVEDKGIDPRRIEVRNGTGDSQKVILWILPAGAILDMSSTVSVDESPVGGA